MLPRTAIYGAGAIVSIGLALAWAFSPKPVPVETAAVTRGHFVATIDEDGKTRLVDRYLVSAPLAGQLSRVTLREGDPIAAGQVVATLTPVLPSMLDDRTVGEQQARIESARANVERAEARIARARVALEQARSEWRRSEQLAQQGFIAPAKLETDLLAVRAAQREVDSATADRTVASYELAQARAALGAVRETPVAPVAPVDRTFAIRSPIEGQVLRVLQTSAGTVALGAPLLEVGDTRALEIVAELLTTDALAAKPGSRVIIERWGGSGTLDGRVARVEPAAFTKVSALGVEEQRVRVLIELTSPYDRWQALGDGFRVGVRIVRIDERDVPMVPVSAVFPLPQEASEGLPAGGVADGDAAPRHAVFVVDGDRARRVPVDVGARGTGMAWIREGPAPGRQVIVYPSSEVADGVRVVGRGE
ncbi:MAG: efflux RND transporter periplasmic adaptor subunit [Lautropia sp.]